MNAPIPATAFRVAQCIARPALLPTDADFCDYLLREFHMAVVPGSVLGLAPYFRISYAASRAELQDA